MTCLCTEALPALLVSFSLAFCAASVPCSLVEGNEDYSGSGKIWASLIIAHCFDCHSVTKWKWGKCLGDGSSQTAMQVLEFRQQKKNSRHL